jgi:hypothetical protein
VEGLNRAYPDIFFIDRNLVNLDFNRKDRYQLGDLEIIPLAWQDTPLIDCMKNKYRYFGLDWNKWKEWRVWNKDAEGGAWFLRDREKESSLVKHLNIRNNDKYNLVNVNFGCWSPSGLRPGTSHVPVLVDNGLRNITLDFIPGYSLFDWAAVIERATNIHTVSTSIFYLLELLKLSAKEIHLYPRKPREINFRNIDYLFTKKYILHN